jgi:hypothetical protein
MRPAGQGGQPLHVHPEQAGEHLGLGLAELWEAGGHVLHRAVALAQLCAKVSDRQVSGTRAGAGCDRTRCSSVAVVGERTGEGPGARGDVGAGRVNHGRVPLLEVLHSALGEGLHGLGTELLGEKGHGGRRKVVVGRGHRVVTGRRQHVGTGRSPAATSSHRLAHLGTPLGDEGVEVPPHRRGREAEARREVGGRQRAVLQHRTAYAVAGALLGSGVECAGGRSDSGRRHDVRLHDGTDNGANPSLVELHYTIVR